MIYRTLRKQLFFTGLIVGIFPLAIFALIDHFNQKLDWGYEPMLIRGLIGLVTLVILGAGIFSGINSVKKAEGGILNYQKGVLTGVLVALVTAVLTAAATFIYCRFINEKFGTDLLVESKQVMIHKGMPEQIITRNLADLKKQLSVSAQVMQAFVGQLISGTIISIVMAMFFKTKVKQ